MEDIPNKRRKTAVSAQYVAASSKIKRLEEEFRQKRTDVPTTEYFQEPSSSNCIVQDALGDAGNSDNRDGNAFFTIEEVYVGVETILQEESDEIAVDGDIIGLKTKKKKASFEGKSVNSTSLPRGSQPHEKLKITTPQFDRLVAIFESNLDIARGKRKRCAEFWKFVADELNPLGPPYKDGTEWEKLWTDFRCDLKKKITKYRNENGGQMWQLQHFTSLEPRVIEMMNTPSSSVTSAAKQFSTTNDDKHQSQSGSNVSAQKVDAMSVNRDDDNDIVSGEHECDENNNEFVSKKSVSELILLQQIHHNNLEEKKYALKVRELDLKEQELELKKKDFQFRKDVAYKNLELKKQLLHLKRDIANKQIELKTAIGNKELEIKWQKLAIEKRSKN